MSSKPISFLSFSTLRDGNVYSKHITEYKVYGPGNVDLLCCRFDPDDTLIASGIIFNNKKLNFFLRFF